MRSPRAAAPHPENPASVHRPSYFHQHVVALDSHGKAAHAHRRIVDVRAGGEVELPSVPRTDHARAVDFALAERAAQMAAGVVDRMEAAARVEDRDSSATHLDDLGAALGNLAAP